MRAVEDFGDGAVTRISGLASVGFDWIGWGVGRRRRGTVAEEGERRAAQGEAMVAFDWGRSWRGRRGLKKVVMLRKLGVRLV